MTNVYFSSDQHFYHNNIIKFCNRPFSSIEEMNEKLIENWNSVVKPKDIIYVLGDVIWSNNENEIQSILKRLNGLKYLITGNHDSEKCIKSKHWASVSNMFELRLTNHPSLDTKRQLIVLNHYAMRTWNKSHHGSWHLFGHSHNTLLPHGQSFDVGVDCWDYTPISVEQVKEKMITLKQDNVLKVFIIEGILNCENPIEKDIISKSESVYVKVRKNFSNTNIVATMYCYAKDSTEAESKFETTVSEYIHNLSTVEEITEICETTRTIFNSVV